MAVYKVPQNVEADDKLLGPFSFRQFIYLLIVAMAIGMGYLLSKIFIGLAIIPLPVVLFFGALALPLRKDQPMEAYMGALISFYFLKPRKRFWVPDGLNELVEITAPRQVEPERVKDISGYEARARLGYLTDIVESNGWAVRGIGVPTQGVTSMNSEMYKEAQQANDIMDDTSGASQKFDQLIEKKTAETRDNLVSSIREHAATVPTSMTPPPPTPVQSLQQATPPQPTTATPAPTTMNTPLQTTSPEQEAVRFNPYPDNIKQSIIHPIQDTPPAGTTAQQSTSVKPPSPDIIKLANDSGGLTVASVAQQAHRLDAQREAGLPQDEVEISLR